MGVRRALIIAPKRVALTVWAQEAKKWNDQGRLDRYRGYTRTPRRAVERKSARTVCSMDYIKNKAYLPAP